MNKAFALAALMSISAIGGANAQDLAPTTQTTSTSKVSVIYITETSGSESSSNKIPPTLLLPNPEAAQAAQTQIQSDPKLMAALQQKNVQIQNVAGIETAADGGKIVYVR